MSVIGLWLRGGFPLSFLSASDADSAPWREFYIRTFLERDIPALGIQIPATALRRFWMMLVHYHGQVFNASDVGHSLNVADTTVRRYLDVLARTFMVRRLSPQSARARFEPHHCRRQTVKERGDHASSVGHPCLT